MKGRFDNEHFKDLPCLVAAHISLLTCSCDNRYKHLSKTLIFCVLFLLSSQLTGQDKLLYRLFLLEDVIFEKMPTADGYESTYELRIRQPLDHKATDIGYFYQKVYLSHRSFDAPTVMVTEGYSRPSIRNYELADHIGANQVIVEHRYYGSSVPDSINYDYLNLEQATADLHKVRLLLGKLYENEWISTGISKGGMTTIFYRYFYPDDVAISIPYVAPINLQEKDPRIYHFLDTVGTDECRDKIIAFEREMLKRKHEILPLVKWFSKGADLQFSYMDLESAYEFAVMEYSFSFWQFGHDCEKIPTPDQPTDSLLTHFLNISGIDFFSDAVIEGYAPFYYQMKTEMGYYGYKTEAFEGLIEKIGEDPPALFPPLGVHTSFDPELTSAVYEWATHRAEGMIYINGEIDTWSATGIVPDPSLNALLITVPNADHRDARIKNMKESQLEKFDAFIKKHLE